MAMNRAGPVMLLTAMGAIDEFAMAQPATSLPTMPPAARPGRLFTLGAGVLGVALVSGALTLWFHYGTAVFFDTIASGIASCF